MSEEYNKALNLGMKQARKRENAGLSPFLTVLDEILEKDSVATQVSIGLVDIPMENILGTKTAGRSDAFSYKFMPLLPEDTEFADKWANLCDAHLEEGIRVPIKAFEYKNRFYVQEGNKRVSVLSYFGAVSIPGTVIRLIPQKEDTTESRIYYEFLDFYKYAGVNYIEFTKEGSYAELARLTYKASGEMWTAEDKKNFKSFYYSFRTQFEALGGSKLGVTAGDAILPYLSVYRYSDAIDASGANIKQNLEKIWEEVEVLTEKEAVEVSLEPQILPKEVPLLTKLFTPFAPKIEPLKIVFLHELDSEKSGWTKSHAEGRVLLADTLDEQINVRHIDHILPGVDDEARLEAIVRNGAQVVFTTSPTMYAACVKVAARHPEAKILNCSLNAPHPLVRTYYSRMHEAKYLLGLLAGILTNNDEIGYVAHYPIYGTPACINAFAMGVAAVRPNAKIILRWGCLAENKPDLDFTDRPNINIISGRDQHEIKELNGDHGLFFRKENGELDGIAMPIWHWGVLYYEIVRSIIDGTWDREEENTQRAINYWWGMRSGAVDIHYADEIPAGSLAIVRMVQEKILNATLRPFAGTLYAQGHKEVTPEFGEFFSPEELIHMDWLAENVVGSIPKESEITLQAKRLVALQGVASAKED